MSLESHRRFSQIVFEEHRHEGVFTIEVEDHDVAAVKTALEDLGCMVEQDPFRPRLKVFCPPELDELEA